MMEDLMESYEPMEVTVDFREKTPLMKWISSIAILKHVGENDIGYMFEDGVLLFHVLRELFEEQIERPDELAEKILPCENFIERLYNWKTINDSILQKLNVEKSNWYLEYLAKGNVEYIKDVLDSIRKIAPVETLKQSFKSLDIIPETEKPQPTSFWPPQTYYLADNTQHRNEPVSRNRRPSRYSRQPSPFPRMEIAREHVIWGDPRHNQFQTRPQHQRRHTPNRFQKSRNPRSDFRYFRDVSFGSGSRRRSLSFEERYDRGGGGRNQFSRPPQVQTYCFMERQRKRRNPYRKWGPKKQKEEKRVSEDVETRFQQLLEKYNPKPFGFRNRRRGSQKQYDRYLYRYYGQFDTDCNYCTPLIKEDENDV